MDSATSRWLTMLQSESPRHQSDALRQLAGHRPIEGLAVRVVDLAGCQDDEVRMWAAEALETSVQARGGDVPALAERLAASRDGETVYWAATLLGRLGPSSAAATDALEACVKNSPYLPARERAAWALGRIGPAAASALPTLREITRDAPPRLKRLAMEATDSLRGIAA